MSANASASDEALKGWLSRRTAGWRRLHELNNRLSRRRAGAPGEALEIMDGYYATAHDLSLARRLLPGTRTLGSLEALYAQLHATLHRAPHRIGSTLLRLLRDEIPATVVELRFHLVWVVSLFITSIFVGWWLVWTFPELASLFAPERIINMVEEGRLWIDDIVNVVPSSVSSVNILANNITVTLVAFTAGILFGLGTFYIVAMNGLMIGALFAFTAQHDLAGRLLQFVVAHGPVELSVICLAGAAGAGLGEALVRPGALTRREAFQIASARIGRMMVLCALLLIGCGFIEGYISPDADYPMAARVAVGVCYWMVMIGALTGDLFGRRRAKPAA